MALDNIPPINDKTDRDALLESIEDQMDQISDAMHKAAKQGNCSRSPFKPKAYWCPELSRLRDRKRFWWFLWTQNDRPRQGILYECYKGVKKLFRQTSRKAVDNTLNNNHTKLNSFYEIRNMRGFWNSIKHRKLKSVPSTLTANDFVEHFKSIMQDDNNLSPIQTAIDKEVRDKYTSIANMKLDVSVSADTVHSHIRELRHDASPGWDGITPAHLIHGNSSKLSEKLPSRHMTL